jgi:sulfur carrier protein
MSIEVTVGGQRELLEDGVTVAWLVRDQPARGVAVARNGEVVPRERWAVTRLENGDQLEIVRPIQGGC